MSLSYWTFYLFIAVFLVCLIVSIVLVYRRKKNKKKDMYAPPTTPIVTQQPRTSPPTTISRRQTPSKADMLANKGNRALIFVSYATKDAELFKIKDIAERLSEYEDIYNVLYWQKDMTDNITEYMNEYLGACDLFILFCSPRSLDSRPVKEEWMAAHSMEKPIIPVFTKPEYIPPLLKSRLGLEYDIYDFDKNVVELHDLINKKMSGL